MSDDRIVLSVKVDPVGTIESDDESDIGMRRQYRVIKARVAELELLHATRFRFQVPTATTEAETKHGLRCGFHPHVVVSQTTPHVSCAVCGEELSPLDVLRQFSIEERNFAMGLEHLRREAADLRVAVERLKRERQNLRAAVKRARAAIASEEHLTDEAKLDEQHRTDEDGQ